ncbi:diacylglycerol kinase family protein [Nocardioides marmorisolisilvae]|nr:diacylglycerol kinase family protein [Nocardioides marmorisolisilvae]
MIDSPRQQLALRLGALVSGLAFVVLTTMVGNGLGGLIDLDRSVGRGPRNFTDAHTWLHSTLTWVAHLTGIWALTVLTVVAAVALWVKSYRRPALSTVAVMAATALVTTGVKYLIGAGRPGWDNPPSTLVDRSFPSGHASGIAAAAGVSIVLAMMLIRRRGLRRLVTVAALVVALLVGADRIFLGRFTLSDVVAGYLLGLTVVLLGLILFDPRPRSIGLSTEPFPEAIPSGNRRVAGILNPIKVDDPAGFRAMVDKMAEESGWAGVTWWDTTVEDTGYSMAHEAAVSGADLVIAIGGDGTIRAVCEELAGTGVPVGIVPAGTGNLLARNLSIPLYLRAAVDVALNGQDRAIDMVRVSGDEMEDATFLVMAGMGFDAAIMEGVNEDFKKKVGWLAYVWSALKALMFPAIRVEVSVDGGEFTKHRARTVVIGNVGHLQAGMPLIPDAAIDDGQLDVVLLYPRRFLSWLPLAARVLTKNPRTDDTITRMRGRQVVVRTPAAAPRQLDGDLIEPGKELRAECDHGRLLVRVPR